MPWETDSGLKDDFVMRVDSVYFEEQEKQGNQLCLVLVGSDFDDPEGDVITQMYTCGPGWESADGSEASHFKDKLKFNRNTKMGRFVDRVAEVIPAEALKTVGEPTVAATYMNWCIHFVAEYKDYSAFKDRDGNEQPAGKSRISLPTEIWPSEDDYAKTLDKPAAKAETKKQSAAEIAKAKLAQKKSATETKPDDLQARLIRMAQTYPHESFAEKALDIDEVAADDDWVTKVMDDSAEGFWAVNQK